MGLKESLDEITNLLKEQQDKKVEKKFKYPFGKKVGKSQGKKNYVTVLVINENSRVNWKKYQIDEQTIKHDEILRLATTDHVLYDQKGNPLIILPSWSVEPFSPKQHFEESANKGANTKGYKVLMAKMQSEQVKPKKEMGSIVKWILGLLLAGVVIYAFIG